MSVSPVKYADDLTTSEFLMGSLPGQTQLALDCIDEWGKSFSLAANGKKTKDMVISTRKEANIPFPPHPTIAGNEIQRVTTFKLLGVHISYDLTWDAHIQYMLSRVRPRIYYLCIAKRPKKAVLSVDVLTQIYLTFIRPILEYASPVWGGLPNHLSDSLESVQKRCMRIIGLSVDSIPTLASRRERATLRTLEHILQDESSPLWAFLTRSADTHYGLRSRRPYCAKMISKTKRHALSFIPRALDLLYASGH